MKNKLILFGLFFALLLATVYGKRNEPDPSIIDEPLKINVDAGKEGDSFTSLAKTIEGKQSLIYDALKRTSAKIEALEERITAEAKATEERWNQRTDVATLHKRPAELACDKIANDLRSMGETTFNNMPYSGYWRYISEYEHKWCYGALIDKRFLTTATGCVSTDNFTKVSLYDSEPKKIKAVHVHPDFTSETPSLNNIALIELENDMGYTSHVYPVCLYSSQVKPGSDLMGVTRKVQIVTDAECFSKTGTHLKPSQICANDLQIGRTFSGRPIYEVQENYPKHKLFGIAATDSSNFEPFVITKVFDHLDFIESIAWPKSGN
ncbi:ovochymase-2-like isoform X2 [Zeugodacus cucurbitae]|uniref:ovochymase-2-like isoform X2 n=1 Tax=Zeugodacus cucurbitae TaxID=28588 RepID=UPI0023D918F3|nr:ovochymase-2-like isoform X2 [Zeugodacus cucurbitae]